MKRILMASDLSIRSDRALERAVALAHDFKAVLEVISVVDDSLPAKIVSRHESEARSTLQQQIEALPLSRSIDCQVRIMRGHDYLEIIKRAEEGHYDLIVLGVHRHDTRDAFRGSTAERVIRLGIRPVLVVKDIAVARYQRVLVPVDLSVHSRTALSYAARLAPREKLYVLHVYDVPFGGLLDQQARRQYVQHEKRRLRDLIGRHIAQLDTELGEDAPSVEVILAEGRPRDVIRTQVDQLKPDLLAVGTHGRTGILGALLGSVAEDMLADAPVDALAVKAV